MSDLRLTKNATDALNGAASCALQMGHDHIGAEHILLSILAITNCEACRRLKRLELELSDLSEAIRAMISSSTSATLQRGGLPLSRVAAKILEMASIAAGEGQVVGTSHIVAAILREGENIASQVLFNAGVSLEKFEAAGLSPGEINESEDSVQDSEGVETDEESESDNEGANGKAVKTPMVNAFGRDLTELARTGKLDPVIGREKELKRVIQILSRRTKNNAVLIGEAGVGKTAVAEGLAEAIQKGSVPERMQQKRVVALDMARVVAGTQYRGQFEERLKKIIDETKRAGNIILFLDEIHTMVGAGGAEGSMDAANILKPALARGELQCVGATTLKEYHKSIEKDAALERRFQSVQVEEPTKADAIKIIAGISAKYEEHHSVIYTKAAIESAVELTARYLPARLLPDKAIDAIDETGARIRSNASERPKELTAKQEAIDRLRSKKDAAVHRGDFDSAAKYREEIKLESSKFEAALKEWKSSHKEVAIEITERDIAETISSISGVPIEKMNESTAAKLLGMEAELAKSVVGQEKAIGAIVRALKRSRAFLADPKRPIGSFLFLGPTGVGKTHLAKMLAEKVYGDEKSLITLDMSEFQEKYSSSRLVGAPPGYVGYDEGGQLTEKVRRKPYSVILFDEFEKANSDVLNMLLQILDEGRLTDGQGRIIDFRNTLVICTANLGFDFAKEGHTLGFARNTAETSYEMLEEKLKAEAKRTFRPELLNRFDETVVFKKLEKSDMLRILDIELKKLSARLGDSKITLKLGKKAAEFLVEKGYDSTLGARPLRRVIQEYLEDPLADLILEGKAKSKISATLSKDATHLIFR